MMFSFIPAAAVAIFKKVEWKQIRHSGEVTTADSNEKTDENT
jgi:hypothetical protein